MKSFILLIAFFGIQVFNKGIPTTLDTFQYKDAGKIHNNLLNCGISNFKEKEYENLEEIMEYIYNSMINCSPYIQEKGNYTYKHQFSYKDVFNKKTLENKVKEIESAQAFSSQGIKIVKKLTTHFFSDENPSDEQSVEFLTNLINNFNATSFQSQTEKEVVGAMLYLTQSSVSFWKNNDFYFDDDIVSIPAPVAADLGGIVLSVGIDALDGKLEADRLDDHIIAGALTSAGAAVKIGKFIKSFF